MRSLSITLAALCIAGVAACKDPNANTARATTSAVTAPAPAARVSATEHLTIDAAASSVGFTGAKVTGQHNGSFPTFTGTLDLDPARVENSRVAVDIDTTSVTTDTPRLTTHLKSADFFDVERFPRATFTSTAIAPGGANGATHTITGNLALHGVTRAISFPATVTVSPSEVTATAEFVINRREFGIVYAGMPDNLIRDDVAMHLRLRAPRAAR
ncbi:MAG: YceI family protein [Myxococcaceae bacterium]|nr:MAG: YceI family protein [Myxococcaceae bacterium]